MVIRSVFLLAISLGLSLSLGLAGGAMAAGGIYFERHAGSFTSPGDIDGLQPVATGVAVSLAAPASGAPQGAIRLHGRLAATETGAYRFTLTSNGPARLSVDGLSVIEMSGGTVSGHIVLTPGHHPVVITYLIGSGGATISGRIKPPGTAEGDLVALLALPSTAPGAIDPSAEDMPELEDAATRTVRLGPSLAPSQAGGVVPLSPNPAETAFTLPQGGRSIQEIVRARAMGFSDMDAPEEFIARMRRDGIRDAIGAHLMGAAFQMRFAQGDIAFVLVEGGAGSGIYRIGRNIAIAAAAPPAGQTFDRWVGGALAVADPLAERTSLRVPSGGISLRASYKPQVAAGEAYLTVLRGTGSGAFAIGASAPIAANAAPAGEVFSRWAGDTTALANPFAATTTATLPVGGARVGAIYRAASETSFTVSVIGGTGSGTYAPGTNVSIAPAAPTPAHNFQGWSGDVQLLSSATIGTQSFVQPAADVRLVAIFTAPQAVVAVRRGRGSGSYDVGTRLTISADAPASGESFAGWIGDISTLADASSPVTILTLPGIGADVTATYAATPITIAAPAAGAEVDERGFTVHGTIANASSVSGLTATIRAGGRLVAADRPISFNRGSGKFALPVFDADVPALSDVSIELRAALSGGGAASARLGLRARPFASDVRQLLSRITFGPTPGLIDEVTAKGFDVFLAEQLNPALIDDSAFLRTNPDAFFTMERGDKIGELLEVKLAYALGSKRQLREVMGNFWENHFYTSPAKEQDYLGELREASAFRVHALGYFRDLLLLSARSSVMMSFLDNDDSVRGRINENYARELMELHTVGVDGGYGNDDVIAVARILTGWRERSDGIERPMGAPRVREFYFDAAAHDTGNKTVPFLNHTFTGRSGPDGVKEGEEFLDMLARHPKTAAFVCRKLVAFFVNSEPPAGLTTRCTEDFLESGGHIGTIVTTILTSPDFHSSAQHYRSNFKTPIEYVASVARSFDMRVGDETKRSDLYFSMANAVRQSGQDFYQFPVPTGFSDEPGDWTGAASMVRRFQHGLDLARSAVPGSVTWNFEAFLRRAPADTAEGVAIALFEVATAGRMTKEEFDAVVLALKGSDGSFDAAAGDREAMLRAMQLIVTMPSFQYQ